MSLTDLVKDCQRNGDVAAIMAAGVEPTTASYLAENVWPVLQALAEECAEIEEDVQEAIEQTEDLLHAETAAYFAALIEVGRRLAEKCKAIPDPEVQQLITSHTNIANQCEAVLLEITIPDGDSDADDPEDEDGDEDEDDKEDGDGDAQ